MSYESSNDTNYLEEALDRQIIDFEKLAKRYDALHEELLASIEGMDDFVEYVQNVDPGVYAAYRAIKALQGEKK